MPREIHQILPTLAYGDAIGNQVLELQSLFREWGYTCKIFAERWHPKLASDCHPFETYHRHSSADTLLIFHYSIGGEVTKFIQGLPDTVLLYYHNITPAHFFYKVNGEIARQLDEARRTLRTFADTTPAIAASPYNKEELEELGFDVLGVAPYILTFDTLDAGLHSAGADKIRRQFGTSNTTDWLYVGRLAPNKCIHDTIKAFYYYHTWIEPASRLILVGTGDGLQPYVDRLYELVTELALDGAVVFAGHHAASDGLAAFYQMADLYVSLSEHEGFCIPLIEAMYYQTPVIAHASTGVPYTLGDAGILIHEKVPAVIAEIAHEVAGDETLRRQLIARQTQRVADFAPDTIRARLHDVLQPYLD